MRVLSLCTVILMIFFLTATCIGFGDDKLIAELLDAVRVRYELIQDYQCRLEESCTKGNRREERVINFYFKKPLMIRMDILKGSRAFDRGSVGVYLGGDKVVGHRGGLLKNLILTLPKESALATTIRGTTFEDSDLFALFRKLIFLNENGVITVTQRDGYFILECVPFDPEINENITKDVVWIESETLLILRNERFEQHELVQETHWSKYILNAGLPDELFDVRFDVGELRKDNIPLIDQEM